MSNGLVVEVMHASMIATTRPNLLYNERSSVHRATKQVSTNMDQFALKVTVMSCKVNNIARLRWMYYFVLEPMK